MRPVYEDRRYGLVVVATDDGPGIRDVDAALAGGNAARGGLGLGLPGARRLMDEFEVACEAGTGNHRLDGEMARPGRARAAAREPPRS